MYYRIKKGDFYKMNLTFYNTLTHKKEEFKPIDEKLVKIV